MCSNDFVAAFYLEKNVRAHSKLSMAAVLVDEPAMGAIASIFAVIVKWVCTFCIDSEFGALDLSWPRCWKHTDCMSGAVGAIEIRNKKKWCFTRGDKSYTVSKVLTEDELLVGRHTRRHKSSWYTREYALSNPWDFIGVYVAPRARQQRSAHMLAHII